uniref:Antifreeze protein n=1 Tax=Panagrolaimus sp. ES5 TaxID=591445 RepID=A0AC34FSB3_9BILA
MFASKTSTIFVIISMILLSLYASKASAASCNEVRAASENARINAEAACAKAAQIAINTAAGTKFVAKNACDDAKYIAKNIADEAAAAACF